MKNKTGMKKIISDLDMKAFIMILSIFLFFFISLRNLTHASLSLDEAVEYWYSKILIGKLPNNIATGISVANSNTMYERVVTTLQPPLYNFLLFFWLLVNDGVWWFRFSSVIFGAIGVIAMLKAIKYSGNYFISVSIVVFLSFCFRYIYYSQECAEYILMLAMLSVAIYYWLLILHEFSNKNIILFIIFCTLSVYSQYGAIFAVFGMIVCLSIKIIVSKEKKNIIMMIKSYFVTFIIAVLPLYFFFVRRQIIHTGGVEEAVNFNDLFSHFFKNNFCAFRDVMHWLFFPSLSIAIVNNICILIVFILLIMILIGRQIDRYIILGNIVTWLAYYIALKFRIYGYVYYGGGYESRYSLFFLPIWIVSFSIIINSFSRKTIGKVTNIDLKKSFMLLYYFGLIYLICFYAQLNWSSYLANNWQKENMSLVIESWNKRGGENVDTIVYPTANCEVAIYLNQYEYSREKMIFLPSWDLNIDKVFDNNKWPEEIYFMCSHVSEDVRLSFINKLVEKGYECEKIIDSYSSVLVYGYK